MGKVGVNIPALSPWGSGSVVNDLKKSSTTLVIEENGGQRNPRPDEVDAQGWIKQLAPGTSYKFFLNNIYQCNYNDVGTLVFAYKGKGNIIYVMGDRTPQTQKVNEWTLDYMKVNTPGKEDTIEVLVTYTDPTDPIRDMRIFSDRHYPDFIANVFTNADHNSIQLNKDFVDRLSPFKGGALRFMDAAQTNFSTIVDFKDWCTPDQAAWDRYPLELIAALTNANGGDLWFNVPHQATNDCVMQIAMKLKALLNPKAKVYVEYSNELWNWGFGQTEWVHQQSKLHPVDGITDEWQNWLAWAAQRANQVITIFSRVFGADRVIGVLGIQQGNIYSLDIMLPHCPQVKAIAIAPYVGLVTDITQPDQQAKVAGWLTESDGGLNSLFTEILHGGLLTEPGKGCMDLIPAYTRGVKEYLTQKHPQLRLVGYEAGQALTIPNGSGNTDYGQKLHNLFLQANRDPRMGDVYRAFYAFWQTIVNDLVCFYHFCDAPSVYGYWGLLEYPAQTSTPKYDAVVSFTTSP